MVDALFPRQRQVATQAGCSPRATNGAQRSHFSTIFFAGSYRRAPYGQLEMQLPQPMHTSASTSTTPVLGSTEVAPVGQSVVQGCDSHCMQMRG